MRLTLNFLFLFLLLHSFTLVKGQTLNPKTEQEVKAILCSKWKLTHMEAQGQRLSLPSDMDESYMTLNADGTFTETDGDKTYQGKWTYDHKKRVLITDDKDGKENNKIIKITTSEMILNTSYQTMPMNMIFKRINNYGM